MVLVFVPGAGSGSLLFVLHNVLPWQPLHTDATH
jgi:hypothetical protein